MICPFSIIQKLQSFVFLNGFMEMNRLFHDILIFWKGSVYVTTEQKSNESQTSPTTPAKLRSKELKLPLIIIPLPPT